MDARRLLDGRLKLRHLVLVTVIADQGTLVGAAKELHVTQPVVTRALRETEEIVGVPLFHRGPRGVRATEYGAIFLEHARVALGNLRSAAERIDEMHRVGAQPIRVGTNLAGAYFLLPAALVRLKKEQPRITVSVIEGGPEELGALLSRREVDLLLGRLQPDEPTGLYRHVPLYEEPVGIVVRQGHPAAEHPAQSLEELLRYPWILPGRPAMLRDELDELFARRGLSLPSDVIECSTILTLRSILLQTDSVAPLPLLVGLSDDALMTLPVSLETVPRSMGITTLADQPPSASVRILIRHLIRIAQEVSANPAYARFASESSRL